MTASIILKKSSVAARVPATGDLAYGELALNYADGALYYKRSDNTVQNLIPTNTGTGTVTSVSGVGSVSGLTLTGTVTSTGSLTLGGTLSLTSGQVTTALGFTPYNSTNPNGYITGSGTAANVSGTVAIANGGTGAITAAAAITALTGTQAAGQYLRSNGTNAVLSAIQAADVPTLNQNTTGTAANVSGTVAIANGGTGQTTRQAAMDALAGSVTAGQYLRGDGADVVMSAIQAADVPTLNQNTTGSAASLTTSRTIAITGDVAYTSGSFNGSANVTGTATLATVNSNIGTFGSSTQIPTITVNAKGLVTAVSTTAVSIPSGAISVTGGDLTLSGTTGTAITNATLASVGTAGTYTKVTTDSKGRVTAGTTLASADIPNLDASKITSGVIDAARLPSYVDDVVEAANLAAFPATGETGKIYVALDTNKVYRWSGTVYVYITSGAVDSVAGKTGVVTLVAGDVGLGNVENKSSVTIRGEITSGNVTSALGFTPYNATNPSGYITSSSLSSYLPLTGGALTGGLSLALNSFLGIGTASPATAVHVAGTGTAARITIDSTSTSSASSPILVLSRSSNASMGSQFVGSIIFNRLLTDSASNTAASITATGSNSSASPAGSLVYDAITNHRWRLGGTDQITFDSSAFNSLIPITQSGNQVLHAGNFTTYSPALTGTGASGTWGISVTGTAANVSGTVAIANGGTGATTRQAAMDALAGAVTSGQYLRGDGTDVVMSPIQAADVPTLNQNTTGTASNVTGVVAIANGGTGTATPGLVAGTNITVSGSWPNQTINAAGGGASARRVVTLADSTTLTVNSSTTDLATQVNTQVAGTLTILTPTGTPTDGQLITIRLTTSNVQTFNWSSAFAGSTDLPLPATSSGGGKEDYLGFSYDSIAVKWHLVAKNFGF
jgi:hypothetical protein